MNARKGILFICPDLDSNLSFCLIGMGGGGVGGRGVGRHWRRLAGKGDAEGPAYGNRAPLVPDSTSGRIMGLPCQPPQHRGGGLRCIGGGREPRRGGARQGTKRTHTPPR